VTGTALLHTAGRDVPIACALDADRFERRVAWLADLADRALTARSPIEGGERLTFANAPAVERELREAIAAESACCAFLSMTLRREAGALVLDVWVGHGP